MRHALVVLVLLAAGCAGPGEQEAPTPSATPATSPASTPAVTPSVSGPAPTPPAATPSPAPKPAPIVVTNGTLEETPVPASTTVEIIFLLNATDKARVNLIFGAMQKPAPYGWSGQVSLRGPDGRIVADSGTSMPEGGAAFTLLLRDLNRTAEDGPGEFFVRARASHPTTLTGKAYVDEAAGP